MITSVTGILTRVLDDEIRLRVGSLEYQILVPDVVRRAIQLKLDEEIRLRTLQYLEGNPTRGRMTPRLVGFLSEPQIEFFELFCTVDGVGVRTALKAMVRSVRDVADMIQRQDTSMLATLPGISGSTAERIVAKLRKKVTKFALMIEGDALPDQKEPVTSSVVEEAFLALLSVGHTEVDARRKLDQVLARKKSYPSAQEILHAIYEQKE